MAEENATAEIERMLAEGQPPVQADAPSTEAEASSTPHPWLESLKNTLADLTTCVQLCEALLQMQECKKLPNVKLYVGDPHDETGQIHYVVPWSHMLSRLQPTALETFFWTPVINHLRERIGKLTLDMGGLNQFIHDKFAEGLPR